MAAKRFRFIVPSVVQLTLSDGDWIEVKERLTFGEQQRLTAATLAQSGSLTKGEELSVSLDMASYKTARMVAYLTDWSFRDEDDRSVPVSRSAIETLDPATADEIDKALDAHIEATAADPTTPTPTSTSP
jgi:hypothetical protein